MNEVIDSVKRVADIIAELNERCARLEREKLEAAAQRTAEIVARLEELAREREGAALADCAQSLKDGTLSAFAAITSAWIRGKAESARTILLIIAAEFGQPEGERK